MNTISPITNIIVSRFSIRKKNGNLTIGFESEAERNAWIDYRLRVFANTLYKSIAIQSVSPFKLILLVDTGDVDYIQSRLSDPFGLCTLCPVKGTDISSSLSKQINKSSCHNIAISRIDSDDIIAPDYLEILNIVLLRAFKTRSNESMIVAFPNGYRSDLIRIQKIYRKSTPFITCFHRKYNGENIYSKSHASWLEYPCIFVPKPSWIQYVHGSNIANTLRPATHSLAKYAQLSPLIVNSNLTTIPSSVIADWPNDFDSINPTDLKKIVSSEPVCKEMC